MMSSIFSSSIGMFGASALGRSTSTPAESSGAVTMKMISRTSMTSTSGVTLISLSGARPLPPPPVLIPIASLSCERPHVKCRFTMLRKSLTKVSTSLSRTRSFRMK